MFLSASYSRRREVVRYSRNWRFFLLEGHRTSDLRELSKFTDFSENCSVLFPSALATRAESHLLRIQSPESAKPTTTSQLSRVSVPPASASFPPQVLSSLLWANRDHRERFIIIRRFIPKIQYDPMFVFSFENLIIEGFLMFLQRTQPQNDHN